MRKKILILKNCYMDNYSTIHARYLAVLDEPCYNKF